jgi:ATP-dependent Clp protease adaptor protein ClpS
MAGSIIKSMQEKHDGLLVLEPETNVKNARPPLYKVLLLNDDYTPMDFVVSIVKQIFHKAHEEAIRIMLEVHNQGSGLCGTYTRDVAETKIDQVVLTARKNEHPLQCVMEKE